MKEPKVIDSVVIHKMTDGSGYLICTDEDSPYYIYFQSIILNTYAEAVEYRKNHTALCREKLLRGENPYPDTPYLL